MAIGKHEIGGSCEVSQNVRGLISRSLEAFIYPERVSQVESDTTLSFIIVSPRTPEGGKEGLLRAIENTP
jgi:hypothetical protein